MSYINKDITAGLKCLKYGFFAGQISNKYGRPFARTNEDIDTYFSKFPIKDGIVATVAGSGDQQLQIAKDGPKEIHVFDKNPLAIHMAKLKTAGCLAFSHEKFNMFFDSENCSCETYNLDDYKVIRDYLDKYCRKYWDAMYEKGQFETKYRSLVRSEDCAANKGPNSYETEENYYKTKSNLEKISIYYYYAELFKFFGQIVKDKKFDAIFLSNIYDWLSFQNRQAFPDFIKNELNSLITQNGMIAVYSSVKDFGLNNGFGLCNGLEKYFPESFDMNGDDKVLIYRKG